MERPTRLCAEIMASALKRMGPTRRQRIIDLGLLSRAEFDRALKCLRSAGVLRRCEAPSGEPASEATYELTGKPLSMRPPRERVRTVGISFDGLLAAWAQPPAERDGTK